MFCLVSGHEIKCYLWQPLLGRVLEIWLIYIYVILFPLLGDASLMLGGDSMVDVGDCLIL